MLVKLFWVIIINDIMKKILFVNGGVKEFGNRFREATKKHIIDCVSVRAHHNSFIVINEKGCHFFHLGEEIDLKSFSYCFIRVKSKAAHMTSLLAYLLTSYNVPYNDHNNVEHTQNDEKITQMVRFGRHGIPIPNSIIFSYDSYKKNSDAIQKHISYPCVLKTNGSKGNAVWKIDTQEELEVKMKEITHELLLVQDVVPNSYDTRALIFERNLLGAIRRYSSDGFYNNVAKGGKTEVDELTEEELSLCRKAMEVLKLDFGGVDFIRTDKSILFFEINKGPQVYGLEDATGFNIPQKIVDIIFDKYCK